MKVVIQTPRVSEGKFSYSKDDGLCINPRFYARLGAQTVTTILVENSEGVELARYIVKANPQTGELKMLKMLEVVPECDGGNGEDTVAAEE